MKKIIARSFLVLFLLALLISGIIVEGWLWGCIGFFGACLFATLIQWACDNV